MYKEGTRRSINVKGNVINDLAWLEARVAHQTVSNVAGKTNREGDSVVVENMFYGQMLWSIFITDWKRLMSILLYKKKYSREQGSGTYCRPHRPAIGIYHSSCSSVLREFRGINGIKPPTNH